MPAEGWRHRPPSSAISFTGGYQFFRKARSRVCLGAKYSGQMGGLVRDSRRVLLWHIRLAIFTVSSDGGRFPSRNCSWKWKETPSMPFAKFAFICPPNDHAKTPALPLASLPCRAPPPPPLIQAKRRIYHPAFIHESGGTIEGLLLFRTGQPAISNSCAVCAGHCRRRQFPAVLSPQARIQNTRAGIGSRY